MKKAIMILLAVCALGLTGCKKENISSDHNYYIKYIVNYQISSGTLNATITDCDGQQVSWTSGYSSRSFERIIGPVQTGFEATIGSGGQLEIYACRDSEPWVLKASGSGSVSYTLDF